MSTEEGNKLIAGFDGWEYRNDNDEYWTKGNHVEYGKNYKYHSSWDWLKPVIDEIFLYSLAYPEEVKKVSQMKIVVGIIPAWERVVNFIQWYNSQK